MVTRIRRGARPHLYIEEWIEHCGLSDEKLGNRMGVSRTTVWRWKTQQHRLNPGKIAEIAHHLGLENWQALHQPPSRPSIDAVLSQADPQTHAAVLELARRLTNRAS